MHARVSARVHTRPSCQDTAEGIIKSAKRVKNGYLRFYLRIFTEICALFARFARFWINLAEGIIKSARTAEAEITVI